MTTPNELLQNVKSLSPIDRKDFLVNAVGDLPTDEKTNVTNALIPTQDVTNRIWMAIVFSFAGVFVGAFVAIAVSLFLFQKIDDKLITIFTTVSAFLAGLIAPSPLKK